MEGNYSLKNIGLSLPTISSAVEHDILDVLLDLGKLAHLHRALSRHSLPAAARGRATIRTLSFHELSELRQPKE
uniref:Uncharacterized protein n=1 Tax=Oryza meridionalis TaxID=40149 RepID=A0A0E0D8A7_9ORYZ